MADDGTIPVTPDGGDGPELVPDTGGSEPDEFDVEPSGAPVIAWLGAAALLAVGVVATIATGGAALAVGALALGVVAVAATLAVELWSSPSNPIAQAGGAAWGLWAALRSILAGNWKDAARNLALVKPLQWFWLFVLTLITWALLWRRFKGKTNGRYRQ